MSFEAGAMVGPYRILEQLGRGGMATVYKAYHAALDRHVAIKVLHPAFKEDKSFSLRFQREAQIVAQLEHRHIVPIYDFAEMGEPFIVMKYIEGETLKQRMDQRPLNLQETLRVMEAVAAGLDYAHQRGILHRDVKPSNVMLDQAEYPYLMDFGLARIVASGDSTMSQDALIGTPNYISPEQARGDSVLSAATDIYSMGIMLYEIVVGRVPFSADTPYAVIHDHIYKALPLPTKVNPSVPSQVEMVLLRALAKDPQDRYPSTLALMEAFQQAVDSAHLSELSAASLRIEQFQESGPPSATTATESSSLDAQLRSVTAELAAIKNELASRGDTPSPYPGSIPSPLLGIGSSALRRQQRRRARRNFWVLSGVAALVFICITSLALTIDALNDPLIAQMPTLAPSSPAPDSITPTVDVSIVEAMDLAAAEAMVAAKPDDPYSYMALSFALFQAGRLEEANAVTNHVLTNMNPSGEMLAQIAEFMAQAGYNDQAMFFWLNAHQRAPQDAAIRNSAGQYGYRQVTNPNAPNLFVAAQLVGQFPDLALAKVLAAQLLLNSPLPWDMQQNRILSLLESAISSQSTPAEAEAYLVYGNFYTSQGEPAQARESWRFASSFQDSPQWVQRESSLRLANSTLE